MSKVLKNKSVIFAVAGSLFTLAGILIYNLLPVSELANGIQYSAKDALWVLALSPVFFFLGGIFSVLSLFTDKKNWSGTLPDAGIYGFIAIFSAAAVISFAVSLSFFITQFKLGFVAPFDGLVYAEFVPAMIAFLLWQFIFTALTIAEAKRN